MQDMTDKHYLRAPDGGLYALVDGSYQRMVDADCLSREDASEPQGILGQQDDSLSARALIEPGDSSSRALIDPGGLSARALIEPGDSSSRALVDPGGLSARALIEPGDSSSRALVDPGGLTSRALVEPGELTAA